LVRPAHTTERITPRFRCANHDRLYRGGFAGQRTSTKISVVITRADTGTAINPGPTSECRPLCLPTRRPTKRVHRGFDHPAQSRVHHAPRSVDQSVPRRSSPRRYRRR